MVILKFITTANPQTFYLDRQIEDPHRIRLLSCSIFNSWNTLKRDGSMSYKDVLRSDVIHAGNKISRGHYSPETLASALMKSLGEEAPLKITVPNGSVGLLFEKSAGTASFSFDKDLVEIFGISEYKRRHIEQQTLFIPRINYPTIFVHCDLVDREKNLFNGRPSGILADLEYRGRPYEKITYKFNPIVFRDASSTGEVNNITLSIRDEDGELFDFNGLPIEFLIQVD